MVSLQACLLLLVVLLALFCFVLTLALVWKPCGGYRTPRPTGEDEEYVWPELSIKF